jgi:hypothetical protein
MTETLTLKPTDAEIVAAMNVSGEHASERLYQQLLPNSWPVAGRTCCACDTWESDDGEDAPEVFAACSDCREVKTHAHCLRAGRCPSCALLHVSLADARALVRHCPSLSIEDAFQQLATADRRAAGVTE